LTRKRGQTIHVNGPAVIEVIDRWRLRIVADRMTVVLRGEIVERERRKVQAEKARPA
jgi:sRNA-binding carbon storage regulator CsrA